MLRKRVVNAASNKRVTEILNDNQPFAFREAYKSLRTNLDFATLGGEKKVLMVTSSVPEEGKSTFSLNLAITLADTGKSVLLIDADLRSPSIHRYLRLRQNDLLGLSNLLGGDMNLDNAVGYLDKYKINIIMSGTIPPNPVELLGSDRTATLIEKVRDDYDYIIFDTPPVALVTDAAVLAQHVDGVILVVGQGRANEEQIHKAKLNLKNSESKLIGAVLNDYDARKDSKNSKASTDIYYQYGASQ